MSRRRGRLSLRRLKRALRPLRRASSAGLRWGARHRWQLAAGLVASLGLGLIATCQFVGGGAQADTGDEDAPSLSVLLQRSDRVELSIDGPYEVRDGRDEVVGRGRRLRQGVLIPAASGISLNGREFDSPLRLVPEDGTKVQIGERRYPGVVSVRRGSSGLEVINQLDMETYVAGVLFSEMPLSFGREALKAQAVAARSYARWRLDHGQTLILPTQADQVYSGEGPRSKTARDIVAATRGEVLEYGGEPFCTYYSSTCGGATSAVEKVFSGTAHPALRGTPCDHCRSSSRYRWQRRLPLGELAATFGRPGAVVHEVAQQVDAAGRAQQVELRGPGWRERVSGQDFRSRWNSRAAAGQDLPAFRFLALNIESGHLVVNGAGFGHGVGMCQYGCKGLAEKGRDYREILNHYYRGADVVRRW